MLGSTTTKCGCTGSPRPAETWPVSQLYNWIGRGPGALLVAQSQCPGSPEIGLRVSYQTSCPRPAMSGNASRTRARLTRRRAQRSPNLAGLSKPSWTAGTSCSAWCKVAVTAHQLHSALPALPIGLRQMASSLLHAPSRHRTRRIFDDVRHSQYVGTAPATERRAGHGLLW